MVEYSTKLESLNSAKSQSELNLDYMNNKLKDVKLKKNNLEEENLKIKEETEKMEKDYIIKIEKKNNNIEDNKKKEAEYNKITKSLMEEIIKLEFVTSKMVYDVRLY